MRKTWWTAAGGAVPVAILAVLVTGCGGGGQAAAPSKSATSAARSGETGQKFGRTAAQADIDTATSAAGLPESGRPQPLPSVTPATATEKDRLKARAAACSAHWMSADREVREGGGPRGSSTRPSPHWWSAAGG